MKLTEREQELVAQFRRLDSRDQEEILTQIRQWLALTKRATTAAND